MYPAHRERYLPAMTLDAIEAIPDKATTPVIIPTGAVEQHGRHLPVGVDSLMGQAWINYMLPHLPDDFPCFVGPAITIGKSNEHTGFPGTLIISKTTLRRQLWAIARQLHAWGFRVLALKNTHGGNIQVLLYTLREIQEELGMMAGVLGPRVDWGISEQEGTYGFHAGEVETAWMLEVLDGERIDMRVAAHEFPARIEDPGELRPEAAPAIFSWATADLSESGVMGDATAATPEKGKAWMELYAKALAEQVVALREWSLTGV